MNFYDYIHLLATYKFVASPPGSCVEGHRTWDALYIGIVPIVKSSITIDYFKRIGLPLWVVHSWNELDNLTEKDLMDMYQSIRKDFNNEALYIEYWFDKIKHCKD
jgi:hypothetical protein